jgi:hypothetical protein
MGQPIKSVYNSEMEKATQNLPMRYRTYARLDLTSSRKALIFMNFMGLALLIFFGWFFAQVLSWLRPGEFSGLIRVGGGLPNLLRLLVLLIGTTALMLLLHEGVHGLFFWLFTRSRPTFAFKGWYAYAAAPGWYLPRNQYLVVGLAPLALISLAGVVLMRVEPAAWFLPTLYVLIMNASGAVGDILVTGWLLTRPGDCFAQDRGDIVTLFRPGGDGSGPE